METTLNSIMTLLSAGFVQRAFIIGILVAILSSMISVYTVLKKLSLIGDGLAHTAYGGIAIGLFIGGLVPSLGNAYFVGGAIVIIGSIMITKAIRSARFSGDAAVAVFLTLGLATGIFVTSVTLNYGFDLDALLFGSILLVSWSQIYAAAFVLVITTILMTVFYKQLLYTVFDEVQARASGIVTWRFDYLLASSCRSGCGSVHSNCGRLAHIGTPRSSSINKHTNYSIVQTNDSTLAYLRCEFP